MSMKWRKEAGQQVWIGRGKYTTAMVWMDDDGIFSVTSTYQGDRHTRDRLDAVGQAKAFAMDLEDHAGIAAE